MSGTRQPLQQDARGDRVWDVIVVGAGPSGSSSATFLARAGLRVLVLDTQHFPRFQVGESLLPICLPILEQLGVEPDPNTFLYKQGATFVSEETGTHRKFDFTNALDGPPRHAWQVRRDAFDAQLAALARAAGATLRHGVKVSRVAFSEDAVLVHTQPAEPNVPNSKDATGNGASTSSAPLRARYLIDASGQGRLLARQFDSVQPYEGFGRAGAVVHFEGIPDTFGQDVGSGNEIQVLILKQAWGWVIPLPDRRLSVGLVTRKRGIVEALEKHLAMSPLLARWTQGATRNTPRPIRNFSYTNTAAHGARYACVGDAACFLDPVFSSGIALGLVSAKQLTDILIPALAQNHEQDPTLMDKHFATLQTGYDAFASIIDRFYHTNFARHFFFGDARDHRLEREITSVLAGDVWRTDNNFQTMLARSRRRGGATHPHPSPIPQSTIRAPGSTAFTHE